MMKRRASEMAQWVKVFVCCQDSRPELIPRTHMVEREPTSLSYPLTSTHVL